MCLITHVDLNHIIFNWRFALFKMLLKLLSPRIGVEWLNVFVLLCLTDKCHVGNELFEDYPPLILESQLDESDDCNCRVSLDFDAS